MRADGEVFLTLHEEVNSELGLGLGLGLRPCSRFGFGLPSECVQDPNPIPNYGHRNVFVITVKPAEALTLTPTRTITPSMS